VLLGRERRYRQVDRVKLDYAIPIRLFGGPDAESEIAASGRIPSTSAASASCGGLLAERVIPVDCEWFYHRPETESNDLERVAYSTGETTTVVTSGSLHGPIGGPEPYAAAKALLSEAASSACTICN
jgi:hypothetical protein